MIRLAFPIVGRGVWTGGYGYLKNTLRLIRSRLADEIEPLVFLSPAEAEKYGAELAELVDGRLIVDPAIGHGGRGRSLLSALLMGKDPALERLLSDRGVDVVFENASFYGWRFGMPVIAWMPDFQHRHMPQMFPRANWWRRDLGFRAEIAAGRTLMLSSAAARDDLERFYPSARGRGHIVHFTIDLDIAAYVPRAGDAREKYQLPERFFFLPNQFWRHKNHGLVIEALARLKAEDALGPSAPPVILTGLAKDPRNPGYFDSLMARAREAGVESHFRYLGLIPYDDVLSLGAACDALINPSRFEGWSTPIEEAKSFATPLMLSDIAIHREQAPHAQFFDPDSPLALASAMNDRARQPRPERPGLPELVATHRRRLDAHASSLLETVRAAVRTG